MCGGRWNSECVKRLCVRLCTWSFEAIGSVQIEHGNRKPREIFFHRFFVRDPKTNRTHTIREVWLANYIHCSFCGPHNSAIIWINISSFRKNDHRSVCIPTIDWVYFINFCVFFGFYILMRKFRWNGMQVFFFSHFAVVSAIENKQT